MLKGNYIFQTIVVLLVSYYNFTKVSVDSFEKYTFNSSSWLHYIHVKEFQSQMQKEIFWLSKFFFFFYHKIFFFIFNYDEYLTHCASRKYWVIPKSSRPRPINMGVDFNDEPVPAYMKNALANISLLDDSVTNEYNEFIGSPRLRKAIASLYSKLIRRKLNPENEVLVTAGGNEAMLCAIRALTKSVGEQWIIIEPFYGPFKLQVELANAVPRFTNLKPVSCIFALYFIES